MAASEELGICACSLIHLLERSFTPERLPEVIHTPEIDESASQAATRSGISIQPGWTSSCAFRYCCLHSS